MNKGMQGISSNMEISKKEQVRKISKELTPSYNKYISNNSSKVIVPNPLYSKMIISLNGDLSNNTEMSKIAPNLSASKPLDTSPTRKWINTLTKGKENK